MNASRTASRRFAKTIASTAASYQDVGLHDVGFVADGLDEEALVAELAGADVVEHAAALLGGVGGVKHLRSRREGAVSHTSRTG